MDLEVQVWLDYHAVDEDADQLLPSDRVRDRKSILYLANQVRQLLSEAMSHLFVVKRPLCLSQSVREQSLPGIDLFASRLQILHVDCALLIGIEQSL